MPRNLVIDAHADTLCKKHYHIKQATTLDFFCTNIIDFHVSKEFLIAGGVNTQVFAIFVPTEFERIGIETTLEMIALAKKMEKDEGYTIIRTKEDLTRVEEDSETLGMILSMEGAVALERNLDLLPLLYELGIRSIGLAWGRKNLFAEGIMRNIPVDEQYGLTMQGKQLVNDMEELGIVIDISHLNQKSFSDLVKIYNKPIIASHSNAYGVCSVNRNLTDDQLMDIANVDGIVGVTYVTHFLNENSAKASVNDVIKHIAHMVDVMGINHVGIGSDFDGTKSLPIGLENASKVRLIPKLLEKEGFSKQDITKILGKNFQRVFEKVWK